MGAACCKRLQPDSQTASPHLPICEVVRRCVRVLCAVNPPQQKPVYRTRKYGLSDIVGPVVKKDSWVQTDPLPPPRRRKRKEKQRKRSRSVEFLPYLLDRESSRTSKTSGSLEDIPGQEDALDFQMYFMSRLPRNSLGDGKECLSGRKKEFLSALLGEENNNVASNVVLQEKNQAKPDNSAEARQNAALGERNLQAPSGLSENEPNTLGETSSRKSSITESLREFESSLLDMLEEDECSLSKEVNAFSKESFALVDNEKIIEHVLRGTLTPLQEEKEDDYVITPLEEEHDEVDLMNETTVTKLNGLNQSNTVNDSTPLKSNGAIINTGSSEDEKNEKIMNKSLISSVDLSNQQLKDQPPTITVEIIS